MVEKTQTADSPPGAPDAPRAAYLHVPFCRRRCGYCNFAVVVGREDLADDFLRAIELEWSALGGPRPVDTLYFGGGTPTQLGPDRLERLCRAAVAQHPLAPGGEWTVEANPDDVDDTLVAMLAAVGVTRLSLGSQSLNPRKLLALDRTHEPDAVRSAAAAIQSAGLQLATDLIFAAPSETLADWQADLAATLALGPDHISTYGLTLERGTAFFSQVRRGELQLAAETLDHSMYAAAIDTLAAAGFDHYEISNFALPGRRSRHNEAYWAGAEYYAAGPGAARYVAGVRETNHRSTTTWLRRVLNGQSPVAEREELTPEQRARERLVFGLRRLEGVRRDWFREHTGYDLDDLAGLAIKKYAALGLFHDDGERVALTREGLFISDAIWPDLL